MLAPRSITVAGSSVHLLEGGDGPAVLLLHGSGPGTTGAGAWTTTMRALGSSFHLVAPDQVGFGRSPVPTGRRSGLATWTTTAADLMDTLGFETYAVVGHSMGGAVALSLAATHPDRVTHVAAVSSMGAPGAPLSPDLDALWGATPDESGARDMLSRLFLDPALVTEDAVRARTLAMQEGSEAFASLFPAPRERWSQDLTLTDEMLSRITAPVLLVHGAQDRVTPRAVATEPLLDALTDVRLHVFGRCGHAPMVEHHDRFQRLLAGFLGEEPPH